MSDQIGSSSERVDAEGTEVTKGGFLQSLLDIIIDPVSVFRRIAGGLTWWKPAIIVAVIMLIFGLLSMPIQEAAMKFSMRSADEEQVAQAIERMETFKYLQPVGGAVWVFIVILLSAVVAHLMISLVSSQANMKKVLALLAFSRLIMVFGDVVKWVVLKLRGFENIESMTDLRVNLSLNAFLPDIGDLGWAFLDSIGLFPLWYFILLLIGIATIFNVSRKAAILPVLPLWAGLFAWNYFVIIKLAGAAG